MPPTLDEASDVSPATLEHARRFLHHLEVQNVPTPDVLALGDACVLLEWARGFVRIGPLRNTLALPHEEASGEPHFYEWSDEVHDAEWVKRILSSARLHTR